MTPAEAAADARQRQRESRSLQQKATQSPLTSSSGGDWQRKGYGAHSSEIVPDPSTPPAGETTDYAPDPSRADRPSKSYGLSQGDQPRR